MQNLANRPIYFKSRFLHKHVSNNAAFRPEDSLPHLHDEAAHIIKLICTRYENRRSIIEFVATSIIEDSKKIAENRQSGLTAELKIKLNEESFYDRDAIELILNLKYLSREAPDKLTFLIPPKNLSLEEGNLLHLYPQQFTKLTNTKGAVQSHRRQLSYAEVSRNCREKCLPDINLWIAWMAGRISYSLSGEHYAIARKGVENYKSPKTSKELSFAYKKIHSLFKGNNYLAAFQIMLEKRLGDCWQQSLLLAMILKGLQPINENFVLLQTNVLDSNKVRHTFITMVRRDSIFFQNHQEFNEPEAICKGSLLVDYSSDIIIVDPWRNLIFDGNLDSFNNPLNFASQVSFMDTNFLFSNFDCSFLELQNQFGAWFQAKV